MTEAEWADSASAGQMLEAVRQRARLPFRVANRKYRLVACGNLRWLAVSAAELASVERGERIADGLEPAVDPAPPPPDIHHDLHSPWNVAKNVTDILTDWNSLNAARLAFGLTMFRPHAHTQEPESGWYAAGIVREVFGDPFRPVDFSPGWRTTTAVELARQMYDSRDFAALPILADALQDAGCDDERVLAHCRGGGVHVRGCWVVDLVLGKA